jgi:hypothetical protein
VFSTKQLYRFQFIDHSILFNTIFLFFHIHTIPFYYGRFILKTVITGVRSLYFIQDYLSIFHIHTLPFYYDRFISRPVLLLLIGLVEAANCVRSSIFGPYPLEYYARVVVLSTYATAPRALGREGEREVSRAVW